MKIEKISIPAAFLSTVPSRRKVASKRKMFNEGKLRKSVVVSTKGCVLDGYVSFLVMLEAGCKDVDVVVDVHNNSTGTPLMDVPAMVKLVNGKIRVEDMIVSIRHIGSKHVKYSPIMRLAERQGYRCYICGRTMVSGEGNEGVQSFNTITLDHKVPRALGGTTEEDNIAACCYRCNQLKGTLMYSDELARIISAQRNFEESMNFEHHNTINRRYL